MNPLHTNHSGSLVAPTRQLEISDADRSLFVKLTEFGTVETSKAMFSPEVFAALSAEHAAQQQRLGELSGASLPANFRPHGGTQSRAVRSKASNKTGKNKRDGDLPPDTSPLVKHPGTVQQKPISKIKMDAPIVTRSVTQAPKVSRVLHLVQQRPEARIHPIAPHRENKNSLSPSIEKEPARASDVTRSPVVVPERIKQIVLNEAESHVWLETLNLKELPRLGERLRMDVRSDKVLLLAAKFASRASGDSHPNGVATNGKRAQEIASKLGIFAAELCAEDCPTPQKLFPAYQSLCTLVGQEALGRELCQDFLLMVKSGALVTRGTAPGEIPQ